MMCMLSDGAITVGTDSLSMVKKFAGIAKHLCLKGHVRLKASNGALILGGNVSWLHRDRPEKKRWACAKDGDLW